MDNSRYIDDEVWDTLKSQNTKIAKKTFEVLNRDLLAGIVLEGDIFWFEFYHHNRVPAYAIEYIKKLLIRQGYRYLYSIK